MPRVVTKAKLLESLCISNGYSKNRSTEILESLIETIKRGLESGDDLLISGFGKFCVRAKKERKGRNPASGEDMKLSARRVVTFKCSGKLREKINTG